MEKKIKIKDLQQYLSGSINDAEINIIQMKRDEDPRFDQIVNILEKIWRITRKPIQSIDINLAWHKFKARVEADSSPVAAKSRSKSSIFSSKPFIFLNPRPAYAGRILQFAVVLIIVFGSIFYIVRQHPSMKTAQQIEYRVVTVPNAQRWNITLSDGTYILADAGSRITYPSVFTDERDLYLEGEAYFHVVHDTKRPFRVHANYAVITVLGTKFNVRAWEDNPCVYVAVLEGKVSLQNSVVTIPDKVIIQKGSLASVHVNEKPKQPVDVDVESLLKWRLNEIHFNNTRIKEIFSQLERWYDYKIVIADTSLLEQRMTLHVTKNNLDEVFELISVLTKTRVNKKDGTIMFEIVENEKNILRH